MVLARFSYPFAVTSLAFVGLVLCLFANIYFSHAADFRFWILLPTLPIVVLYAWDLLRQLVFHGGRAVWIAGGNLIFLPYGWPRSFKTFLYTVPLEAIDHFSVANLQTGSFVNWLDGIWVHRKAGGVDQIPVYLLVEPRDAVLARLNEALAVNR